MAVCRECLNCIVYGINNNGSPLVKCQANQWRRKGSEARLLITVLRNSGGIAEWAEDCKQFEQVDDKPAELAWRRDCRSMFLATPISRRRRSNGH